MSTNEYNTYMFTILICLVIGSMIYVFVDYKLNYHAMATITNIAIEVCGSLQ